MDGIVIIDKESGYTSRDVVNIVGKTFKTKKVGHTGTLDPLATGVLVICVNKATKLVELLTCLDKEYIADFTLGIDTDTLDSEGNILSEEDNHYTKEEVESALKEMVKTYNQEVPKYSAVKVNGRKLYEYARNNEEVVLPKHEVTIYSLELLDIDYKNNKTCIKVKAHVSKGTYIRSLGKDIASILNTTAIMTSLRRTKQGKFNIEEAIKIADLKEDNLITLDKVLSNYESRELDDNTYKYVINGRPIENKEQKDYLLYTKEGNILALYKDDNNGYLKPFKMFI